MSIFRPRPLDRKYRDCFAAIRIVKQAPAGGFVDPTSAEARLAKALDKLETIMQHNQGLNPENFDYRFNLGYGQQYTAGHPLIIAFRTALDRETQRRADEPQTDT